MNGYKNLMTAVLANVISDYIKAVNVGGLDFSKKLKKERVKLKNIKQKDLTSKQKRNIEAMARGEDAKHYIFDDSDESENYVFGFKFICTFIGLNPEKFRKKIREKREEFWKDVYAK